MNQVALGEAPDSTVRCRYHTPTRIGLKDYLFSGLLIDPVTLMLPRLVVGRGFFMYANKKAPLALPGVREGLHK